MGGSMNNKEYLEQSSRTVSNDTNSIGNRLLPSDLTKQTQMLDLLHASIGMVTEAGEFADALKKHVFYGKELDKVNLIEELGDQIWYIALALRALDTDFDTVMNININKLKVRYPGKFTEHNAINRDLTKEGIALGV
jgi:NTP pyrophosphatase (non-canonical NTP hydrolase)